MEEAVLERLGLSKKEVRVYLTLLRLGELSALEVSRKAKIERVRTYSILESLIEKGLVSFVSENRSKKFKASYPDKFLQQLKEKEASLMEVLPKLRKISLSKEKNEEPSVEVFRGTRGVKALSNEILELKKNYCAFCEEMRTSALDFFLTHFMRSVDRENIQERLLLKKRVGVIKSKNAAVRFLPEKYSYHATTVIYDDKVGIIFFSDPFLAIRIKSKALANTYRAYFEIMWEISKKE